MQGGMMPNLINNFPEILTTCRFYVELKLDDSKDPVDAYFMECKGFKRTQEVIEVCEVTPQKWGKANHGQVVRTKVPGNVKSNNLVLRRGMTCSPTLWKWFEDVQAGNWAKKRHDGSLTIYDQESTIQARFEFQGAWPTSYTLTDVSASSNEVEIEEVEVAIEVFTRVK
jgi:phage tail-like protein